MMTEFARICHQVSNINKYYMQCFRNLDLYTIRNVKISAIHTYFRNYYTIYLRAHTVRPKFLCFLPFHWMHFQNSNIYLYTKIRNPSLIFLIPPSFASFFSTLMHVTSSKIESSFFGANFP